jgi:hypothetical protein
VQLESAGKCDVGVVVAHLVEFLDICGHLGSADGAWQVVD